MTARINVPGLAFGAKVELRPNTKAGKGSEIIYVPQVAFPTKNSDEWKWYTLEDLNAETLQSLGPISEAKYLVTSPAEEERLKSRLRELGLQPGKLIERNSFSPQPEVKTRVTCLFDLNIVRCVAKIAFNYLAYVLGEDTRLLLRDEFESIRNFARHRLNPETDIVYFSGKPKLGADERKNSLVDGHILAVGWDAAKENLICGLSFFNAMSYKVVLCRKHRAVWFPVNNAHSFDLRTREVKKIPLGFWTHEAPPE